MTSNLVQRLLNWNLILNKFSAYVFAMDFLTNVFALTVLCVADVVFDLLLQI